MLPASNRGAGQNLCFPDVCLTPAPPAPPIPVPYPNIGLNAQAQGFAPNVKITGVHALNLGSKISMTSGDEAGAAHPSIKGAGGYGMGNPVVTINKMPAINLTCQANGNMMNAPMGAVLVPSAVNVTFCDARAGAALRGTLEGEGLRALGEAVVPDDVDPAEADGRLVGDVGHLRLAALTERAAALLEQAMLRLEEAGARAFVLDLRQNGGGSLGAALAVAELFLGEGEVLVELCEADGDRTVVRSRCLDPRRAPLWLVVDRGTASSAEVLAGALAVAGRAAIVGERTYGKGRAARVGVGALGAALVPVAEVRLAGDQPIQGEGLAPHHPCPGERALERAHALATASLAAAVPLARASEGGEVLP